MDRIDINCDVGEGYGIYQFGQDEKLLEMISSANIACGFHAGDPLQMKRTVELCLKYDVAIGAHPGYPDISGFGRRVLKMTAEEIKNMIIYQAGALSAIAKSQGGEMTHIKPHGALYTLAAFDLEAGTAVAEAVASLEGPALVVLAGSLLVNVARSRGLRVIEEGFADRSYHSDGSLAGRHENGSVLSEPNDIAIRVLNIVKEKRVQSLEGLEIGLNAETICVHGDNSNAVEIVKEIRRILHDNAIRIIKPV